MKIRSGCEGGGKGALIQKDKSATLATNNDQYLFQPTGFDRYNQCSTGDKCETLRTPGGGDNFPTVYYGVENPTESITDTHILDDQGGSVMNVRNDGKAPTMRATADGPSDTLVVTDYKDPQLVAYQDKVGSLCASDHKGIRNQDIGEGKAIVQEQPIGTRHYIVRRLTPTECARLQGFADRWGDIDAIDRMSAKDYQFWKEVRNTHAAINGKKVQDYTVKQMVAWYNKLQTDSSEYKMWGNGIALPTALYALQGIADVLNRTRYDGYNTETAFCDEPEDDDSWMN